MLEKVAKTPTKFNPTGWCTDMAGANLSGIYKVYGESARIKSCEFQFKDHRNKQAKKLGPESADEFKTLCDVLLNSTTENAYNSAKEKIDGPLLPKRTENSSKRGYHGGMQGAGLYFVHLHQRTHQR